MPATLHLSAKDRTHHNSADTGSGGVRGVPCRGEVGVLLHVCQPFIHSSFIHPEFCCVVLCCSWFREWCDMHRVRAVFAEENATVQHLLRGLVPIVPIVPLTTATKGTPSIMGARQLLLRRLDNAVLLEETTDPGGYQLSSAVVEEASRAAQASELSSRMAQPASTAPPSFPAVYVLLPYRLGSLLYEHYDVKASLLEPSVYKR